MTCRFFAPVRASKNATLPAAVLSAACCATATSPSCTATLLAPGVVSVATLRGARGSRRSSTSTVPCSALTTNTRRVFASYAVISAAPAPTAPAE
ncbi:hypothetical protein [Nonomuraea rubra]|uniref:hypothetical protein n=1 Tax=Nonomuraea rubra TaxID=46180 RepID=UPI0031EE3455